SGVVFVFGHLEQFEKHQICAIRSKACQCLGIPVRVTHRGTLALLSTVSLGTCFPALSHSLDVRLDQFMETANVFWFTDSRERGSKIGFQASGKIFLLKDNRKTFQQIGAQHLALLSGKFLAKISILPSDSTKQSTNHREPQNIDTAG